MNRKQQDLAWSVLPNEFKEEVKKMFQKDINTCNNMNQAMRCILVDIFGIHNLTSYSENLSEPKPAESKFKIGDHVRVISADKYGEDGYIVKVDEDDDGFFYTIKGIEDWRFFEPNLKPYAEANEKSRNLSQETANCDKHFDNILKDSFRNERRLNIAVQLASAMIPKYQDNGDGIGLSVLNEKDMIKCAYRLADYLIAECELTEKLKEN